MNNTCHIASTIQKFDFQICGPKSEILDRVSWYPTRGLGVDLKTSPQILN